jgi:hypothetical protein
MMYTRCAKNNLNTVTMAECQCQSLARWPSGPAAPGGCSAVSDSDSESGCLSADSDVSFEFGQKRAPARSVRHGACFQLEVQVGGSMKVFGY